MLIGLCIPCQHGNHEKHYDVIQAVSPGMLGGARCGCTGDCEPKPGHARRCPYCEGAGCSECDGTGERVTTLLECDDGTPFRVSGSRQLDPEALAALKAVAEAAKRPLDDEVRDDD